MAGWLNQVRYSGIKFMCRIHEKKNEIPTQMKALTKQTCRLLAMSNRLADG